LRTYQIKNLDERINHLRKLVEQGKRDPVVYEFARRAVNKKCGANWCVPEKDNLAEIKALFAAVRANVRYTSDIAGIDSYQAPRHTLKLRTADCDDYSSLVCAAAATLGLPCRFKVIRTKGATEWNHIYAQVGHPRRNPSKWISFDASVNMPVGWEAPKQMVDASRIFPT
jgi:transglutaminase-like putative cysteine protease